MCVRGAWVTTGGREERGVRGHNWAHCEARGAQRRSGGRHPEPCLIGRHHHPPPIPPPRAGALDYAARSLPRTPFALASPRAHAHAPPPATTDEERSRIGSVTDLPPSHAVPCIPHDTTRPDHACMHVLVRCGAVRARIILACVRAVHCAPRLACVRACVSGSWYQQ